MRADHGPGVYFPTTLTKPRCVPYFHQKESLRISSSLPADKLFKLCLDLRTPSNLRSNLPKLSNPRSHQGCDGWCWMHQENYLRSMDSVVFKGKGDAKPTEETLNQFKELFKNTFKAQEAYAIAHPEFT
ncbi:hypothetical protein Tco_0455380 [Tanacetum coccineum]